MDMIGDLLHKYDALLIQHQQKCDDYENEVESRRMWRQKEQEARKEAIEARHARESNPFVFVAIDGDGAIFQDKFLKAGAEGGAEAAQELQARLRRHIAAIYPDSNTQEWSIVVHVILNVEGLSKTLQACGLIKSIGDLYAFGRSFASSQPLFSFIDVGYGKEQADHKIRENLRFMIRIGQCKHVFFGPCHDNGYLPVLSEYKRNESFASRFSLISGTAPEPGFRQLGFAIEKYDDIFRTTNLVAPAQAPQPPSPPTTVASPRNGSGTPLPAPVTAVPGSYAKVGPSAPNVMTISLGNKKPVVRKSYLVNCYDERLDPELPRLDLAAEKRYMDRVRKLGHNYCNKYHLLDDCPNGEEYCNYEHGEKLPAAELAVLRYKCRSLKCTNGSYCDKVDCPFGHHCRMGNKCTVDSCRYYDTHYVDLRPATRIFEDGTRVAVPAK
ncbi:uncharacterized protein DNG_08183 [Cephalotrichum gorgonifer]|uniref:C3H1-type domain-containing protein n=1 Tax=Cephalotrichum gorgonifer TaxID=2041049 RepID=A0AAE8N312_9PEZI|nr:uncharacterized protein DNG_08183 [Cephalotrichum gorgonifer]